MAKKKSPHVIANHERSHFIRELARALLRRESIDVTDAGDGADRRRPQRAREDGFAGPAGLFNASAMKSFPFNLSSRRRLSAGSARCALAWRALLWILGGVFCLNLSAAPPATSPAVSANAAAGGGETHFNITGYAVRGNSLLATNVLAPLLSPYTGTNVSLHDVVRAAAALHYEYARIGFAMTSVALARDQLTNGIVTFNVFRTDIPQVVISGECVLRFTNVLSKTPASAEELASARAGLDQTMAELKAREAEQRAKQADTRVHVVSTNAGPHFAVAHYLVAGNTVLTPENLAQVLTNIDGAFGTNVSFDGVRTVVTELQKAYRERGYVTVAVGLPPQKLTNATVNVQVTEGRLAAINVTGNRYFSSNNVMRALPGLHTNLLLNGPVFQAELNQANANRDRQIYPVIGPGPLPGTSALTLKVKDQLPLHGKLEFNNQNSPGTPGERVNASAVYNNLWQREHALGVQYSFSPQAYKQGDQWNFYDLPLVANYSAFYRLPLGNPQPVADVIADHPGSFGYSEATHRFNLPPPSGQTDITLYGSRSTIDTGVDTLDGAVIYNVPGVREISRADVQQDLTVNEVMGFRLNRPLSALSDFNPSLSAGLDYKKYSLTDNKTNIFDFSEITRKPDGSLNPPIVSSVSSPVPVNQNDFKYLPLALGGHAAWRDGLGAATLGLDLSANLWYASQTTFISTDTNGAPVSTYLNGSASLQHLTGSAKSSGHWVVLRPAISQQFALVSNWVATVRADGQWASEPLISNEQFGAGGVNSVRGYHEGEVFGDSGWHISLEQQTPPHVVGLIGKGTPLTVRGSVYMDYAETFLIDPQGRPGRTSLWGTGFGTTAAIGANWEARFLFSVPLLSAGTMQSGQPFFNFDLTAQF
jgi:hemolysin activation/secretion protein